MVRNSQGQIALRWTINTNGKTVQMGEKYYVFQPKMNVVMAWVDPQDVPSLLNVREKICNCNNGTKKLAFEYCSLVNVNLWMFANREGSLLSDYVEVEVAQANP